MTLVSLLCLAGLSMRATAEDGQKVILLDLSSPASQNRLSTRDLQFSRSPTDGSLHVESGTSYDWPSLYISPDGHFDWSNHDRLRFPVKNLDDYPLTLLCRIDSAPNGNDDAKSRLMRTFSLQLAPKAVGDFQIHLQGVPHTTAARAADFFGMNGIPWFTPDSMYTDNVVYLIIFVIKSPLKHHFEIGPFTVEGNSQSLQVPPKPFPLIDEFGQFKHADWPGKTHSPADLRQAKDQEAVDLSAHPRPPSWDKFGGWQAGPQFPKTGKFSTVKYQGKWFLLDPEGHLFFSQGIDCVDFGSNTVIDGRSRWFAKLPDNSGQNRQFYSHFRSRMVNYHYFNQDATNFSFSQYNLSRKYGNEWRLAAADLAHRRLASWGINTIGNWSAPEITTLDRTPFVATAESAGPVIAGSIGYWVQFPDVWDPEFANKSREYMRMRLGNAVNDPWCIGIFVDNELSWGNATSLGSAALASPGQQAAKRSLIEFLKSRYPSIQALNAAWDCKWSNWNQLQNSNKAVAPIQAAKDLEDFTALSAHRYFSTIRDILRELAPGRLYLGCRFAEANSLAIQAAEEICDIVSFNVYQFSPNSKQELKQISKKPIMIGEFHFGALDRGQFHPGLVASANQTTRAAAYTSYVRDCLRNPQIVGCHWFQYIDEPTTGRSLDGENYQIGFLDNVDTPYPEIIAASRALADQLYHIRLAEKDSQS